MSVLQTLTEGIIHRDTTEEAHALLNKWNGTGLLEGITDDRTRQTMAVLLENQAKELLREASSMAAGDVEGFAAVAFPIVRRVFGGLIANDLVSVQPMSLPSGLIFFLDFVASQNRLASNDGESLYGGGRVASQITGGVSLSAGEAEKSFYALNSGFSSATGSCNFERKAGALTTIIGQVGAASTSNLYNADLDKLVDFDPDLQGKQVIVVRGLVPDDATSARLVEARQLDARNLMAVTVNQIQGEDNRIAASALVRSGARQGQISLDLGNDTDNITTDDATFGDGDEVVHVRQVRRLTKLQKIDTVADTTELDLVFEIVDTENLNAGTAAVGSVTLLEDAPAGATAAASLVEIINNHTTQGRGFRMEFPIRDGLGNGGALGSVVGQDPWGLEEPHPGTGQRSDNADGDASKNEIAEIDIKVDSIAVTAQTKKLKAKWTPELAQDLNAYHSLDAEVELTGILSEQIALEIDQEILQDLVKGATAATLYWSRRPGQFVNRTTGAAVDNSTSPPDFTGTVSEWYETLVETINDVSAQIHRKTLRGGANFLVTSPEIANLLEFTSGFRASITHDDDKGTVGALKAGSISKKWDVYVDPYFMRNVILVGRKGSSFLESGYVYAPYVPLQTTPTIFGTEDFIPRKGVMTRYAKKMVRPDLYGLVIVRDLVE